MANRTEFSLSMSVEAMRDLAEKAAELGMTPAELLKRGFQVYDALFKEIAAGNSIYVGESPYDAQELDLSELRRRPIE